MIIVLFAPVYCVALPRWLLDVQQDLVDRARTCDTVALTVALFPLESSNRGRPTAAHDMFLPTMDVSNDCAFAIVTDRVRAMNAGRKDWQVKTISCANCTSNERQRRAHVIKTFAPLLFPHATNIYYGDVKCRLQSGEFPYTQFDRFTDDCTCAVRALRHPSRFGAPLVGEFDATVYWMNYRHEDSDVIDDIDRLGSVYASRGLLGWSVDLPDTMCLSYTVTLTTQLFAMLWTSTVLDYSMREQLSFNVATYDSGLANETCYCYDSAHVSNGVAYIDTSRFLS